MPGEKAARINQMSRDIAALSGCGDFAQALPMAVRMCDLVREFAGDHDPAYAAALDQRAKLHYDMADFATAEFLLRQALEVTRIALEGNDPRIASRLNGLALVNKTAGKFAEAATLYREAIAIYRSGSDEGDLRRELPTTLRNLGELHLAHGEFAEAREPLQQALASAESASPARARVYRADRRPHVRVRRRS